MSGNQWGPPPGPQYPPPPPPPQWQPGPTYGGPPPAQPQFGRPQFAQSPPGPPQFGWGPGAPPPPRKKKGRGLLIALFGLVAFLVIGGIGVKFFVDTLVNHPSDPAYSQPTTSEQPGGGTTSAPTGDPLKTVSANKLYQTGVMATVNCKQPKIGAATSAQVIAYSKAVELCLNHAWAGPIAATGGTFRAPAVVAWSGAAETPCGANNRSFYCAPNHTIYISTGVALSYNKTNPIAARMFATFTIAHEYGHAVQWMSGIGPAYSTLRSQAPTEELNLQTSRRLELQASCFAGVFLGANRVSYGISGYSATMMAYVIDNSGDRPPYPNDHGSPKIHASWVHPAEASRNPASCNTWTASPARVS